MATQTSIEAYYEGLGSEQRDLQKRKVYNALIKIKEATGNKIARHTGIPVHLVFARLNDLLKENKVKQTGDTIVDKITKRTNLVWKKEE